MRVVSKHSNSILHAAATHSPKIRHDTPRTMNGANNDALHRLRSAIICNFDLAAVSSTEAKNAIVEAKTFIDQVESQMKDANGQLEGWKYFLHLITVETERPEVPFLCLQRLINQLGSISARDRKTVRDTLLGWLSQSVGAGVTSSHGIVLGPKYIRTKLSVLVAKIIQMDYPESWNAAFEDIATML